MFSDELFSDDSDAPAVPRGRSGGPRRPKSPPLGFKRLGRLGLALVLLIGTLSASPSRR